MYYKLLGHTWKRGLTNWYSKMRPVFAQRVESFSETERQRVELLLSALVCYLGLKIQAANSFETSSNLWNHMMQKHKNKIFMLNKFSDFLHCVSVYLRDFLDWLTLEYETKSCPEMSVTKYHFMVRKPPEKRRPYQLTGRTSTTFYLYINYFVTNTYTF